MALGVVIKTFKMAGNRIISITIITCIYHVYEDIYICTYVLALTPPKACHLSDLLKGKEVTWLIIITGFNVASYAAADNTYQLGYKKLCNTSIAKDTFKKWQIRFDFWCILQERIQF